MKLKYKLSAFTVFALLAPMLVVSIYAASLLYRNVSLAQWAFLQSVSDNLEKTIREEEDRYAAKISEIAGSEYLQAKLYVYSKYWDKISPATLEFDLYPFQDFVHNNIMFSNIDSVLIFRKSGNKFVRLVSRGPTIQLPESLSEEVVQKHYSAPQYFRAADGIYLRHCRPFFSSGRIVGLVILQKGLNAGFLDIFATRFDVNLAVSAGGSFVFNSEPGTADALHTLLANESSDPRVTFESNGTHYHGVVRHFDLGNGVGGTLVLYAPTDNIARQSFVLIRKILAVSLVCLLIPVITFVLWGSSLVRAIHSILRATNVVATGDLDHQVPSGTTDEIGLLASNFNEMVQKLKQGRNVLETRNRELQLKNSYIDAVFQSLMVNIFVLDASNRIVASNRAVESRLEFAEEPTGKNLFDIGKFGSEEEELKRAVETARAAGEFQRIPRMEIGNAFYEIDLYPMPEQKIGSTSIVMILVNITDRMETERALNRSEKLAAVGQIAAGLAHEINNPMGVILNHVQLIESGKLTDRERKVFVGRVKSEIMRISKLIEKLLKFSKDEIAPRKSDYLSAIAVDVLDLFEPRLKSVEEVDNPCEMAEGARLVGRWNVQLNGAETHVCLTRTEDELPVLCDRSALQQVMINLLSNSLKSVRNRSGVIHMHVRTGPSGPELRVQDNGVGIPQDCIQRIFDPFFTRNPENGTGLGLSLCQKIIRNHGGTITVTSRENEGTEVTLVFPRTESAHG